MLLISGTLATVAIFVTIYIWYCYYNGNLYKINRCLRQFPSPPSVPFFHNALAFSSTADFLKTIHKYTTRFGSLVCIRIGPIDHFIICSNHDFVEFMLQYKKVLKRSTTMRFLEPWIGKGLITADGGPKWRDHRKLVNSMFQNNILEQFVAIFETNGDTLVSKLSKVKNPASVDIYPFITLCSLDIICEAALGTKINAQNNEVSDYFQSVKDMLQIYITRTTSIFFKYEFIFKFSNLYQKQKKALKILHDYTNQIISEKLKKLKNEDLDTEKNKSFLDILVEATIDGRYLSHEELREEIGSLMFAGHDTTATAMSFILYCLANHKEEQKKVFQEQQQLFGSNFKYAEISYLDLQKMKYLDNVIKEGLRLYTPVPIIGRQTDQELQYDGISIPDGVTFAIFAHGIHMNPRYYPDPEKFDPSRFENTEHRLPYAFIPFSVGPRNCIGQKFALLEIKSVVSKIIRHFEIIPAIPEHHVELASASVLKSLNGVKIGLKLRDFLQ